MAEDEGESLKIDSEIKKFKKYRMQLDINWNWQKKKLGCRIRPENADPTKDSIREIFAELAGSDLNQIINEMKAEKKLKEQQNKVHIDYEGDKKFKEVLTRSRVLGATKLTIEKLDEYDRSKAEITQNVLQQYAIVPKSPSKRVLLEIQRERAKPLRLPDQDFQKLANEKLEKQRAKQRAARMAAMEQSAKDEEAINITLHAGQSVNPATVLAKYHGDKFSTGGDYLDGVLYLSRAGSSKTLKAKSLLRNFGEVPIEEKDNTNNDSDIDNALKSSVTTTTAAATTTEDTNSVVKEKTTDNESIANGTTTIGASISSVAVGGGGGVVGGNSISNSDKDNGGSNNNNSSIINGNNYGASFVAAISSNSNNNNNNNNKTNEQQQDNDNESQNADTASTYSTSTAKLQCAASLCSWSRSPANASRLANEGAVRAINILALEPIKKIGLYCAAAYRYMSEHLELAIAMIEETKTISTISEMINNNSSNTDDFMAYNLAIALVNLTRVNGKEGVVVDAAIVLALMNLTMMKPELNATCVRGLYNLTCVDTTYTSIERVIRALVTFSLSGTSNVKHLCAAALCNLSDLKSVRARMVEEGVIGVLSSLSRGAETRTRRVCAVILQNLSAARSVRVDMVSRSSVSVAYSLSSDQDPIILRCIGLTLSRLSMESSNCQKIIHESGVAALGSIAVKYPTIPGISQPVSSAFQLLSANPSFRVNIVNEGSVTAIASLLRSSVDIFTLQHSLLALCNLLCEPENHLPIIQQGLILTLISMCDHVNDLIKDFCSLAFLNLSCAEDSRKHLVNAGAIVAIINIASQNSAVTKRRCAATLCNLSYYSAGMTRMVADGIIPSIVQLVLAKDIVTVHYSCAALCRLCCTVENSKLILESDAVPNLVLGAKEGDPTTKQFCGAVLSSLSYYESCRVILCDLGAIAALKGLAELNDETTKQRCLVAFANLSCELTVQVSMIKTGVVRIIAELANSLKEVTYICCAKAICNLACNPEYKLSVATDGGVHVLLMISMVQSVEHLTKLLCVIGLNNLLDYTTIDFMLSEGLINSISNLSKLGINDPTKQGGAHISMLSAKIFNHLTSFTNARNKIVESKAVMSTLFNLLCKSTTVETQVISIRTTCNLVLDPNVRGLAILAGGLLPIERGIEVMDDKYTIMQCLLSLFYTCNNAKFMEIMTKTTTIPQTLIFFAMKKNEKKLNKHVTTNKNTFSDNNNNNNNISVDDDEFIIAIKILVMLSWEDTSRYYIQNKEFLSLLFQLIISSTSTNTNNNNNNNKSSGIQWLSSIIRFVVLGYNNLIELLDLGIINIILTLNNYLSDSDPTVMNSTKYLIYAIRSLTVKNNNLQELIEKGVLTIIYRASSLCSNDSELMMELSLIMYLFAHQSPISRLYSSNSLSVNIYNNVSNDSNCFDLLAVALGYYLTDSKSRVPFAIESIAKIIVKIADSKHSEATTHNLVLAIYGFSKITSARDFLYGPTVLIDKVLNRLGNTENPKIKANIQRAFKNFNTDSTDAIEEGEVATLIAMSLEGKLKNQASDRFMEPKFNEQIIYELKPPECSNEISLTPTDSQWFERVKVANGGAAGKGPDPPEPPSMTIDSSSEYPSMAEEIDSGEIEGKTKMAFAKMQVPQNVKDIYILTDTDFMLSDRSRDDLSGNGSGAYGIGGIGGGSSNSLLFGNNGISGGGGDGDYSLGGSTIDDRSHYGDDNNVNHITSSINMMMLNDGNNNNDNVGGSLTNNNNNPSSLKSGTNNRSPSNASFTRNKMKSRSSQRLTRSNSNISNPSGGSETDTSSPKQGIINRQFSSTDTDNSSPKFRKRAQTQLKPIGGGRDNTNNINNNAVVEKAAQLGLFS